jgi:hypothetical protein
MELICAIYKSMSSKKSRKKSNPFFSGCCVQERMSLLRID